MKKFLVILLGILGGFSNNTFGAHLPFYKKQSPPLTQEAVYRFLESNEGAARWNITQGDLIRRLQQRTDHYVSVYGVSSEIKNHYSWKVVRLADYFPNKGSFETDYINSQTGEIESFFRKPYPGELVLVYEEQGRIFLILSLTCGNTKGFPTRVEPQEQITRVANPSLLDRTQVHQSQFAQVSNSYQQPQEQKIVYVERHQTPVSTQQCSHQQCTHNQVPVQEVRKDNTAGKILIGAAVVGAVVWAISRNPQQQPRGSYIPTINGAPGGFGSWNSGPVWGGPGGFNGWGNTGGGPGGFTGW